MFEFFYKHLLSLQNVLKAKPIRFVTLSMRCETTWSWIHSKLQYNQQHEKAFQQMSYQFLVLLKLNIKFNIEGSLWSLEYFCRNKLSKYCRSVCKIEKFNVFVSVPLFIWKITVATITILLPKSLLMYAYRHHELILHIWNNWEYSNKTQA